MTEKIYCERTKPERIDLDSIKIGDAMPLELTGLMSGTVKLFLTKASPTSFVLVREYWFKKGEK